MKLSIIIPTFNSGTVLGRALDSIVCQTFTDWEVLIMDGASTDDTTKVAQSYNDSRIRIYSEPDKGIYDAMNKGIKKAQGEWLYFLGSDDWLLNDNVLKQVFSLGIENHDVVYGDVEAPQLPKECMGEWSVTNIGFNRCHQAVFYKKKTLQKLGYYNLRYPILADHDLNMKWFFSKGIKKSFIPQIIAHYSEGGYSVQIQDNAFYNDYPYILLARGWSKFSVKKKIRLAEHALKTSKISCYMRVLLYLWVSILKMAVHAKDFILNNEK